MNDKFSEDRHDEDAQPRPKRSLLLPLAILSGVAVLVLGIIAAVVFGIVIPNGVTSDGNKLMSTLSDDYRQMAGQLHTCKVVTANAIGVTQAQTKAQNDVLTKFAGGQFGNVQDGSFNAAQRNAFIIELRQAYPDLTQFNLTFTKSYEDIVGCQRNFQTYTEELSTDIKRFDDWQGGSWTVRTFGGDDYPNERLTINLPGVPAETGQAALNRMRTPVLDNASLNGLQTGVDNDSTENKWLPNQPTPSATK